MTRHIALILFSILLLFGCSKAEDSGANQENGNEPAQEEENSDNQPEAGPVDESISLNQAFTIHIPEGYGAEARQIQFTVRAIDYLKDIHFYPNFLARNNSLVLDLHIKNTGDVDISVHDFPHLFTVTESGEKKEHHFRSIENADFQVADTVDLVPGGETEGLFFFNVDQGTSLDKFIFKKSEDLYTLPLNSLLAKDEPKNLAQGLRELQNKYYEKTFSNYDEGYIEASGSFPPITTKIKDHGLSIEPESLRGDVDYATEFIRDEQGNITGVRFIEQ